MAEEDTKIQELCEQEGQRRGKGSGIIPMLYDIGDLKEEAGS